jgi:hypothetical protein
MDLRSLRAWLVVLAGVAVVPCGGQAAPVSQGKHAPAARPKIGYADIGGYRLAYECAGTGRTTVILEAGYTASGIGTYGPAIVPALARRTPVCTYDRAGDGLSDSRARIFGGEHRLLQRGRRAAVDHVGRQGAGERDHQQPRIPGQGRPPGPHPVTHWHGPSSSPSTRQ